MKKETMLLDEVETSTDLENIHKTGDKEESSASVLGPMIPQVPLEQHKTKGEYEMNIPEEVLEFVVNPDATYTYEVEAAFDKTVEDMHMINLPYKVRKLTIERAMLRVKISWLKHFPKKQQKVRIYQKRLVEVESALRRITKSVSNADERKRLEKGIRDLDKQTTLETKKKIKNKQVVERVNAIIEETVEDGLLPKCFLENKATEEMLFFEGANWDLHKSISLTKKICKEGFKNAKKAMKLSEFKTAAEEVVKCKKAIAQLEKDLRSYPEDKFKPIFFGMGLQMCRGMYRDLLSSLCTLFITPASSIVAYVWNLYTSIKSIGENVRRKVKDGKSINISIFNDYYNESCKIVHDLNTTCDKIITAIKEEEKNRAAGKSGVPSEVDKILKKASQMKESEEPDASLEGFALTEGVNWDLHKVIKETKKSCNIHMKLAKQALKKENFAQARNEIGECKKAIAELEKEIRAYPEDEFTPILFGMGLQFCRGFCRGLISSVCTLFFTPASIIVSAIWETILRYKSVAQTAEHHFKQGKEPRAALFNEYYGETIKIFNDLQKKCDAVMKSIDEEEKNRKSGKTGRSKKVEKIMDDAAHIKESVEEDTESVYRELTSYFEAGYIDRDEFNDLFTEAKKPDDGMMDILNTLNKKGYITKYSCSGHKASFKKDRNNDGIINGKMESGARIMFKGDYDFPDPPKHWGWKTVDGVDYLYVLPISHNAKKVDNEKAFAAWKNKYMASLERWVKDLPDVSVSDKVVTKKNPKKEKDIMEAVVDDDMQSLDDMIDEELAYLQSSFF